MPVSTVVQISGPYASAIERAIGSAWVAESFEQAVAAARMSARPVATLAGDLFLGPLVVRGGGKQEARGILAIKREIKELVARVGVTQEDVRRLGEESASLEATAAQAEAAIARLQAEQHEQDKALVGARAAAGPCSGGT